MKPMVDQSEWGKKTAFDVGTDSVEISDNSEGFA